MKETEEKNNTTKAKEKQRKFLRRAQLGKSNVPVGFISTKATECQKRSLVILSTLLSWRFLFI